MIGRFLFLCVASVGVLGILVLIHEARRRLALHREVDARARARAAELAESRRVYEQAVLEMPRASITSVLQKLEQSAGFAVAELAMAPAQPTLAPMSPTTMRSPSLPQPATGRTALGTVPPPMASASRQPITNAAAPTLATMPRIPPLPAALVPLPDAAAVPAPPSGLPIGTPPRTPIARAVPPPFRGSPRR